MADDRPDQGANEAKPNVPLLVHATPNNSGAIAILQLIGDSAMILRELTGTDGWPIGKLRFVKFGEIDEGLAVRLTERVAQIMPHGGPRVVQKLTDRILQLGVQLADPTESVLDPQLIYPEAADRFEAIMLATLARAVSPLAIDLLLDQPRRWREFREKKLTFTMEDRTRSRRLNRLVEPAIVVLAGRPNVGKSTLSNAMLGRSMSIAYDLPGTTRDYTTGQIELAGLVVHWHDTPGIRETTDPIERKAIELSQRLIGRADVLIAMRDPQTDWPVLPREPDLRVLNKTDLLNESARSKIDNPKSEISISAATGDGVAALVTAVRDALIWPDDLVHPGPWLIDERLL